MVASVPLFQATMVPSSVSKMKEAGLPLASMKGPAGGAVLNTIPVGVPGAPIAALGVGMPTTRPCFTPWVLYSVDTPALLSEIQKGLPSFVEVVGLSAIPQGLTSWES